LPADLDESLCRYLDLSVRTGPNSIALLSGWT